MWKLVLEHAVTFVRALLEHVVTCVRACGTCVRACDDLC